MTPRYPGAVWMPVGSDQGANNGPRAFSWHIAVTRGTKEDIASWVAQENSCHAFNGQHGDMAQYKDFDRAAYGVLEGNYGGVVTIESWDNLAHNTELTPDGRDANHSEWDAGQVERTADVIAWADVALGIPIRFMSNTRESGHAPHRLGVPEASGNVQIGYGPDRWTSHPGKACPGDMRVVCLRDVAIPRARVIAAAVRAGKCGWLPTGPVNVAAAFARTGGATSPVTPDKTPAELEEEELMAAKDDILAAVAASEKRINAKIDATSARIGAVGSVKGIYSLGDVLAAIAIKTGAVTRFTPIPPPATYTVVSGDSFGAVAKKLGVTPDQLAKANPKVTNRDNIDVGDVLTVPKV